MNAMRVVHFLCPRGMFGAERWIVALIHGLQNDSVRSSVCIALEDEAQRKVAEQFREAGVEVYAFEGKGSRKIATGLRRHLNSVGADILHTHGYKSDVLGLFAVISSNVRIVSTPHGFGQPTTVKHRLLIELGKRCLRFMDRVVPLSQQLYDEVAAVGVPSSSIELIENGVDLTETNIYRARNSPDDRMIIGFVGQLIERKRLDHLLRVFDRLWIDRPQLRLRIVGSGDCEENLRLQAEGQRSVSAIEFLGFRKDRLELMSEFNIFAMTSADEGIPRCLMEAMALGIASVAYDIRGVDILIDHEETGLLAEFGDEAAFEKMCRRLLDEPRLRERLGDAGKLRVEERFSNHRMGREYTALYKRVLAMSGDA